MVNNYRDVVMLRTTSLDLCLHICYLCNDAEKFIYINDLEVAAMRKKGRALMIIELLKKEYPNTGCSLEYDEAWKLLVSVRLAAQCTDARVNVVVKDLYEKYPTV